MGNMSETSRELRLAHGAHSPHRSSHPTASKAGVLRRSGMVTMATATSGWVASCKYPFNIFIYFSLYYSPSPDFVLYFPICFQYNLSYSVFWSLSPLYKGRPTFSGLMHNINYVFLKGKIHFNLFSWQFLTSRLPHEPHLLSSHQIKIFSVRRTTAWSLFSNLHHFN